jgi:hypothetical protein
VVTHEKALMTFQGTDSAAPDQPPTAQEGFRAMIVFLENFFQQAGEDVATLMADLEIQEDGDPLDPAAWSDWLSAIERIRNDTR